VRRIAALCVAAAALTTAPATGSDPAHGPDTAEPGSVLAVIQKGYQLNNRLLRPARVVVACEPDDSAN